MPGFSLAVLDDDLRPAPPDTPGVLAVHRPTSPLFAFDGYWAADTPSFRGDWYLTGDTVQQDPDGHIFFVGRNDDIIITSAGYRIGPFDVESSIVEHQSVAEVAVVGKPDPERTEIVKAFIVLRPGFDPSDGQCHVWTYMDPARLQPILASSGLRVTTADVYGPPGDMELEWAPGDEQTGRGH